MLKGKKVLEMVALIVQTVNVMRDDGLGKNHGVMDETGVTSASIRKARVHRSHSTSLTVWSFASSALLDFLVHSPAPSCLLCMVAKHFSHI